MTRCVRFLRYHTGALEASGMTYLHFRSNLYMQGVVSDLPVDSSG